MLSLLSILPLPALFILSLVLFPLGRLALFAAVFLQQLQGRIVPGSIFELLDGLGAFCLLLLELRRDAVGAEVEECRDDGPGDVDAEVDARSARAP